jgi:hypothetical protein
MFATHAEISTRHSYMLLMSVTASCQMACDHWSGNPMRCVPKFYSCLVHSTTLRSKWQKKTFTSVPHCSSQLDTTAPGRTHLARQQLSVCMGSAQCPTGNKEEQTLATPSVSTASCRDEQCNVLLFHASPTAVSQSYDSRARSHCLTRSSHWFPIKQFLSLPLTLALPLTVPPVLALLSRSPHAAVCQLAPAQLASVSPFSLIEVKPCCSFNGGSEVPMVPCQ